MANLIIGFAGPDRVGKTTAALRLEELGFAKFSMGGPAKEIVSSIIPTRPTREDVASTYQYLLDNLYDGLKSYWHNIIRNYKKIVVDDLRRERDLDLITCGGGQIILLIIQKEGYVSSTIPHLDEWENWSKTSRPYKIAHSVVVTNNGTEEQLHTNVIREIFNYIGYAGIGK